MKRLLGRAWPPSRIGLRLLAFNLLVVFVPVVGVLYLDVYETQLLQAQEREMVQQGRLLAGAAASGGRLDEEAFSRIIIGLERQSEARFRLYDATGITLADSARMVAPVPAGASAYSTLPAAASGPRSRWLYRVGALIANARHRLGSFVRNLLTSEGDGTAAAPDAAGAPVEVRAALAGRYGATTRQTGPAVVDDVHGRPRPCG